MNALWGTVHTYPLAPRYERTTRELRRMMAEIEEGAIAERKLADEIAPPAPTFTNGTDPSDVPVSVAASEGASGGSSAASDDLSTDDEVVVMEPAADASESQVSEPGKEVQAAAPSGDAPASEDGEVQTGAPELPKDEMSFAEMFELAEKQSEEKRKKLKEALGGNIRPGQVIFAKVVGFAADSIFVDVGAKAEGVIAKSELADEETGELDLKEGDKIEARIRKIDGGTVILTKVLPHQSLKNREELREAHRQGIPVEARVTGQNKGGFDVELNGIRAFCPASQIDLRPSKDVVYVGKKYPFKVTEFKDGGKNIVVSRRQVLIEENQRRAKETLAQLDVGSIVDGEVTSVRDYGAFVDIGGLEGLVHMSEISHGHLGKPGDKLKVGYLVKAKVLKIEDGKKAGDKKISLSMKALENDPWDRARAEIREGMKVRGKVARIQSFGAFVEILPGVDGLVHVSNMKLGERVTNPKDVVKVGEEVEATVLSVDWGKKRIGLSLAKTPAELANELRKGSVVEGTVDKIESFGLFVKLTNDARGLVPAAETGTHRGADLTKEFSNGDKVRVTIMDVDAKNGKIRLSIRVARQAEERAEFEGFLGNTKEKGRGLGTLGDLFRDALGDLRQK
ncbi:MAG: S1 RNA-binding domain-containing protein [Myxococcales bacterium]|nr:S1 RNA-binding domain-containing protein [Myxococcales bacterium]